MSRENLSRCVRTALVTVFLALFVAASAQAVPAFARKYETSCQTCHVAYPKLNPYGQAFRTLGYRMPGETEAQVKQPEVPLGAKAYKRVWPNSVWPGAIPSHVPFSMTAEFQVQNSSTRDGDDVEEVDNELLFPSEVALIAAGTAGDNISYFGEIGFSREVVDGEIESEAEIDHIDFRFIRPIRDSMAFNVKIGSFQPELVATFDHARRLTVANYDSMFSVAPIALGGAEAVGGGHGHGGGASGVALPAIGTGLELYGVINGRIAWSAGVVDGIGPGEGTFDANGSKDLYGRIAYKWGGLAFDGSNTESFAGSSKNWRERSFSVGFFAYSGDGSDIFVPFGEEDDHGEEEEDDHSVIVLASEDDEHGDEEEDDHLPESGFLEDEEFTRIGIDFNWYFDDLHLFGAYYEAEDTLRAYGEHDGAPEDLVPELSGDSKFSSFFIEADVVLGYPWLHGAARFESVDFETAEDWERATLSLTGLVRANLKTTLEHTWDLNDSANDATWLSFGIAF